MDDHPAVHAADNGDEPFGFEDTQRLANDGRETPNRSTRSGSRPIDSPSESLPLTISARSSSAICCGFSRLAPVALLAAT